MLKLREEEAAVEKEKRNNNAEAGTTQELASSTLSAPIVLYERQRRRMLQDICRSRNLRADDCKTILIARIKEQSDNIVKAQPNTSDHRLMDILFAADLFAKPEARVMFARLVKVKVDQVNEDD